MCNRCDYNSPDNQIYVDPLTNEYYLDIAQNKLALMFEIAVYQEKMNIDDFSKKFIESEKLSKA